MLNPAGISSISYRYGTRPRPGVGSQGRVCLPNCAPRRPDQGLWDHQLRRRSRVCGNHCVTRTKRAPSDRFASHCEASIRPDRLPSPTACPSVCDALRPRSCTRLRPHRSRWADWLADTRRSASAPVGCGKRSTRCRVARACALAVGSPAIASGR